MSNPPNNPVARTTNSKSGETTRSKSGTRSTATSHSASTPPPTAVGLSPPTTSSKPVAPSGSSPPTTSSKPVAPSGSSPPTTSSKTVAPSGSSPPTTSSKTVAPSGSSPTTTSSKTAAPSGSSPTTTSSQTTSTVIATATVKPTQVSSTPKHSDTPSTPTTDIASSTPKKSRTSTTSKASSSENRGNQTRMSVSPAAPLKTVPPPTSTTTESEHRSSLKSMIPSKTNDNEKKTSTVERQRSVIIDEKAMPLRRSLADTNAQSLTNALASSQNKGEAPYVPSTPPQTPAVSLSSFSPELQISKPSTVSTFTLPRTPPQSDKEESATSPRGGLDRTAMTTIREGIAVLQEALRDEARQEQEHEDEAHARETSKGKANTKDTTKRSANEGRPSASSSKQSGGSDVQNATSNRSSAASTKPQDAKRPLASDRGSTITEPRQVTTERQSLSNAERSKKSDSRAMSPIDSTDPTVEQMWSQQGSVFYFVPSLDDNGKSIGSGASRTPSTKAPASAKHSTPPALPRSAIQTTPKTPALDKMANKPSQPAEGTNVPSATPKTPAPAKVSILSTQSADPLTKQRPSVLKNPHRISVTIKDEESGGEYDEEGRRLSCSETRRRKSVTYQPDQDGSGKEGQDKTEEHKTGERRKSALSSPPPTPTISQSPSLTIFSPPPVLSPPPTPTDEALTIEMTKEHIRQGILSLAEYIPIAETPKSLQRIKDTAPQKPLASDEINDSTRHALAKMKSAPLQKSSSANLSKNQTAKTPQKDNAASRRPLKHTEKERPKSVGEGTRKNAGGAGQQQLQPRPSTLPQLTDERRKTIDTSTTRPNVRPDRGSKDGATTALAKSRSQSAPDSRRRRRSEDVMEHGIHPHSSGTGPGPDHLQHSARFPTVKYTDYAVTEDTSFFSAAGQSPVAGVARKEDDSKARKTSGEGAESAAPRESMAASASRTSNPAATSRSSNAAATVTLPTSASRSSKGEPEKSSPMRRGSVAPD